MMWWLLRRGGTPMPPLLRARLHVLHGGPDQTKKDFFCLIMCLILAKVRSHNKSTGGRSSMSKAQLGMPAAAQALEKRAQPEKTSRKHGSPQSVSSFGGLNNSPINKLMNSELSFCSFRRVNFPLRRVQGASWLLGASSPREAGRPAADVALAPLVCCPECDAASGVARR